MILNYKRMLLEKSMGNDANLLKSHKLREELNLQFKRLSIQSELKSEINENEEHSLLTSMFQRKYRNCGKVGHKGMQCKTKKDHINR